jgi:arabinofuranan 3-O-arabinosyltransferase
MSVRPSVRFTSTTGCAGDAGAGAPAPAPAGPTSTSDHPARLTWTTTVTGAQQPYWVVLGQSLSPGFRATTSAGVDLGPPTLVNGFANGWLIDPAEVGADQTITITWAPQRLVWFGLGASVLGVLACLVLLCWPRRRRSAPDAAATEPIGIAPFAVDGGVPTRAIGATLTLATATVSWIIAGPFVALGMAAVAALAAFVPRGQVVVRLVGIGMWDAAAGFVILKELRNHYVIDFNWMNQFEVTHAWTLAAVICLALDTVVSAVRNPQAHDSPVDDSPVVDSPVDERADPEPEPAD